MLRKFPSRTLEQLTYPDSYIEDGIIEPPTSDYAPLGFTLYRTDYTTANSDQLWLLLLERLQEEVKQSLTRKYCQPINTDEDREICAELQSLVHMDGRSDAATLQGRTMDELRAMYINKTGGEPLNYKVPLNRRVFLMVDEEVFVALADPKPEKHWVKIVDVNYEAERWGYHPRVGKQTF